MSAFRCSVLLWAALWPALVFAQASCSSTLTASYAAPSMAPGFVARLIMNNLTNPRGIQFDSKGALLVVEQGLGISALNITHAGSDCLGVSSRKLVVAEPSLNHGIEMSPDGNTIYASSGDTLWSWQYSAQSQSNTSAPRALVTGMAGSDHTSRTLLLSRKVPGMMMINHGSNSNVDAAARDLQTGHSQVKAFNITSVSQPLDFNTQGLLLGWGLRNDVGLAEEPLTGGIYSVENGADQITRDGEDIHLNNPAEELNFLGYLNGTKSLNQGRNFGYPDCFSAWQPQDVPGFKGKIGEQFALGGQNSTLNDTTCSAANRQAPRLVFQAHMAPLDILFNPSGTAAWITFHGSWNRDPPVGYDLRLVSFAAGQPTSANTSTNASIPIMSNADLSLCPQSCFRPVGLAWHSSGSLVMSSDSTGEIYALSRADGNATSSVGANNATGTSPSQPAASTPPPSTTTTPSSTGSASSASAAALAVFFALLAYCL